MNDYRSYINDTLEQRLITGVSATIRKGDETLLQEGFGYADREARRKVTPDTVLGIGSVTKSFTALAIMQLHDAGKLNVDAPVADYLTNFTRSGATDLTGITLHHFLTNTSGLPPLPFLRGALHDSVQDDPNRELMGLDLEEYTPAISSTATVQVTVTAPPPPPVASPGNAGTVPGNVPGPLYVGAVPFDPLANDSGTGLRLVSVDSSASIGTATLQVDGTIHYAPAAGYTGPDSFFYTVESAGGMATGTMSLTVAGRIWFVDAAAGQAGDGRYGSPFSSAGQLPELNNGDVVFFHAGDYAGAPTLKPGVRLVGQAAAGSISGLTGLSWPAGTPPPELKDALTAPVRLLLSGDSLELSSGNQLHGLHLEGSAASEPLLHGADFGSLTVSGVSLRATGRDAVHLVNGQSDAVFSDVVTVGGTVPVALTQLQGTVRISGGRLETRGELTGAEQCVRVSGADQLSLKLSLLQLTMLSCDLGLNVDATGRAVVQLELQRLDVSTRGGGINLSGRDEATIEARMSGSTLRTVTADNSAVGFRVVAEGASDVTVLIDNSTLTGASLPVHAVSREATRLVRLDLTMTTNVLNAAGPLGFHGLWVEALTSPSGDLAETCMDVRGNTITTAAIESSIRIAQHGENWLIVPGFTGSKDLELAPFLIHHNQVSS